MSSPRLEAALEAASLAVDHAGGTLLVDALADGVLRLRHARSDAPLHDRPSYALDPDARWDGPADWTVRESDSHVEAQTARLRLRADRGTGAFVVEAVGDGARLVEAAPTEGVGLDVALRPDDRLFGLGDKALSLDRRGHRLEMWNTDAFRYGRGTDPLYKSVPFVLKQGHGTAVGLFVDNSFRSRFDLGQEAHDRMRVEAEGGDLDVYVLWAPSPLGVVEAYARLTGRTPLLPRWALGYHQCRYSYMDEGEVREVAEGFRSRRIPCDALYFDIHYMDGYRVFTWDRDRFPDPRGLIGDLHGDGFRTVVIVDPGVKADDPDYDVYREGAARDAYVTYPDGSEVRGEVWPGTCAFPDFTDGAVREWWGGLHAGLVDVGVDGVWNDMNEPALFAVAHQEGSMAAEEEVGTIPGEAVHSFEGAGGTHLEAHNVYGMQMQRATHEGLARLAPQRRPFTITRAAYAGAQRFGTGWTGDNTASWDHLRLAVQTCLSLGVSGMPFVGADVGGFVGTPTGELLARWTQVGALTPLFRNHSAIDTPRQEPWLFGDEVERVCREAIELRYRLLPHLYTALWQASTRGTPILRALPLVHPDDETVRRTSPLGFYVGDGLLAHPVVEEGQREREIYLPETAGGWVDLATFARYEGRETVWTETPLDRLPLYVRGGSVLALGPVRQHTGEPCPRLELHVVPAPGRHTSWLYDDTGDGPPDADSWTGRLDLEDDGASVRLETSVAGAYAPEWEAWDLVVHGLEAPPARVEVGGLEARPRWDDAAAAPVLRVEAPVGAALVVTR